MVKEKNIPGLPDKRVVLLAGLPASGKTYYATKLMRDSNLHYVVVNKSNVRIVAEGSTYIDNLVLQSSSRIEQSTTSGAGIRNVTIPNTVAPSTDISLVGIFPSIMIEAPAVHVDILSGKIEQLSISKDAAKAVVKLGDKVSVSHLTADAEATVTGKGQIEIASINANGV